MLLQTLLLRQYLQINYPQSVIQGDQLVYFIKKRKRKRNIAEVVMELNINEMDISYKEFKRFVDNRYKDQTDSLSRDI